MAEDSESTVASDTVAAPKSATAALRKFVAHHHGAQAVIAPIGAAGVRIVAVGADGGTLGDAVVADTAAARAVIDAIDGLDVAEWDRELTSTATPRAGHWAKMAGWVAHKRYR